MHRLTMKPDTDIALDLGMLACFNYHDGQKFHIAVPNELKLAWQKHREHAAKKKRQMQLPVSTAPGHLDGAVANVVGQQCMLSLALSTDGTRDSEDLVGICREWDQINNCARYRTQVIPMQ
jgi:hypothetical protein